MENLDIRRKAAGAGVHLWQIAEALRISDSALSRKLRRELDEEKKREIMAIIDTLAEAKS